MANRNVSGGTVGAGKLLALKLGLPCRGGTFLSISCKHFDYVESPIREKWHRIKK